MSANDQKTGFSFSLGSMILIALSIGATVRLAEELLYARQSDPRSIRDAAALEALEGGEFVEITGRLDYQSALVSSKAVGDDYLLAPLAGFDNVLWVSIKNGAIPATAAGEVTFRGRIEAKDGAFWTIGDAREIDLVYQARQLASVAVPSRALVLRDGVRPGDGLDAFTWVTGAIGVLMLLAYLQAVVGAVRGVLRSRGQRVAVAG